ncbi:MAG: SPOR domain-containing protein, partial [Pseudomonadota bacterium]
AKFFSNEQNVSQNVKFTRFLILSVAVIAVFISGFYLYDQLVEKSRPKAVAVIKTNKGPRKIQPEEPGGMKIPHLDMEVYDSLQANKVAASNTAEQILPGAEKPVDLDRLAAEVGEAPINLNAMSQEQPQVITVNTQKQKSATKQKTQAIPPSKRLATSIKQQRQQQQTDEEYLSEIVKAHVDAKEPVQLSSANNDLAMIADDDGETQLLANRHDRARHHLERRKGNLKERRQDRQEKRQERQEQHQERRQDRQEKRQERQEQHQERRQHRQEKRQERQEQHQERRQDRQEKRQERQEQHQEHRQDRQEKRQERQERRQERRERYNTSENSYTNSTMPEKKSLAIKRVPPKAKVATGTRPGYYVQLASFRSPSTAEANWQELSHKHNDLLNTLEHVVIAKDIPGKGLFYRLQAGPFTNKGQANVLCNQLGRRNQNCFINRIG